jgi:hypothetical protein
MRTLFTLLALGFFSTLSMAQSEKTYKYSINGSAEYGFLIGHHSEMNRLSTRYFPSFTIYGGYKTAGNREWQRKFNYPELGVGLFYSPLMFNDELGQAYAAYGYFLQNFGKKERGNFSLRFGFGLGYLSSKFNAIDNNQNIAIGSNVNIYVFFELQKSFRISKNIDLNIGIGMSHFSNTGVKMPNLGINLASGEIGLKYLIGEQDLNIEEVIFDDTKRWAQSVILAFGRKQSQIEMPTYTIINPRYEISYALTYKSSLIGSADLFFELYDNYQYEYQAGSNEYEGGIAAGYLLDMKQFQASLQWGAYLFRTGTDYPWYYHRLGFKWVASEHLLVNLSLRTEWARARNVELGLGWRF